MSRVDFYFSFWIAKTDTLLYLRNVWKGTTTSRLRGGLRGRNTWLGVLSQAKVVTDGLDRLEAL